MTILRSWCLVERGVRFSKSTIRMGTLAPLVFCIHSNTRLSPRSKCSKADHSSVGDRLLIDYRHFDANDIEPRFEFGFGLSYTNFSYSNLHVKEIENDFFPHSLIEGWEDSEPGPSGEGSSQALWCVFCAMSCHATGCR